MRSTLKLNNAMFHFYFWLNYIARPASVKEFQKEFGYSMRSGAVYQSGKLRFLLNNGYIYVAKKTKYDRLYGSQRILPEIAKKYLDAIELLRGDIKL